VKYKWIDVILAVLLAVVVPGIMFSSFYSHTVNLNEPIHEIETTTTLPDDPVYKEISVLMEDGVVQTMELDDYLFSVVLREMPADFEKEALKAQAVVARTYTLRREMGNHKHKEAAVCTDPSCCQGFCTKEEYLTSGGDIQSLEKVSAAVNETNGEVLTYQGELIEATYFSCSGGSTEDAKAVWGADIPYLKAQESPGEEKAKYYVDSVSFTVEEFMNLLGVSLYGNPETWVENVTYTNGGGVDTIRICGKDYSGVDLRKSLGLRSTAFTFTAIGNTVIITTKGFGHRVGMSQYGADAMALRGSTYREILLHYYPGTELVRNTLGDD